MALVRSNVNSNLGAKLLWTNSNPSASFPSQTISLNLTDYDGVIVEAFYNNTDHKEFATRVYARKADFATSSSYVGMGAGGQTRNIKSMTNTGITFQDGYTAFGGSSGSSGSVSNNVIIPNKIYGVKNSLF